MAQSMRAQDIFPQLPNEPDIVYGARTLYNDIPSAVANLGGEVFNTGAQALSTPASRATQAKTGNAAIPMPHAYDDPVWSAYENKVAEGYGNPTLANALSKLRLLGEKSNSDQVNKSTGAQTPYQITATTRQGIMKNFGFDPWSSPLNAVRGAAVAATTYTGPKANFNDPAVLQKAAGGYFGGKAGADNPYSSGTDSTGTSINDYASRVAGIPFLNSYDPAGDKLALQELDVAKQGLMTPQHFAVAGPGPAPEMPKPEAIPQTDFSQSDAALQNLKPITMSEKDKLTRERQGFWKGLGQAMANMPENEGLGTFFLRLGGGAIAGRAQAQDEIVQEQSKFDDKMAQYNAAVFTNDLNKAKVHAGEMQAQVQQNNQYNLANWQTAYDRWKGSGGTVDISGTNAVITRKDDKGNVTVDTLPIAGAVSAQIALGKAQIFSSMGGRQMAGQQQGDAMKNAIIGRAAIQAMSGSSVGAEADAAAAAAPAAYATFVTTHGGVADVIGPDGAKSLEQNIQKQLLAQQVLPGSKDFTEKHDQMMATELTKLAIADPAYMKKLMSAGSTLGSFEALDAVNSRKITTRTDAKTGLTSTGSTMNAADVFDSGGFNQQLSDHGYSRY